MKTAQLLMQFARLRSLYTAINAACISIYSMVLKAHRRTGVAQQMVTYLQQVAQREGASALTVSADLQNEAAQQSYLAMGFKRCALTGAYFLKNF